MIRSERLFAERQTLLKYRFSFTVFAFIEIVDGQIIQAGGIIAVILPNRVLDNRQRPLEQRFCFLVLALALIEQGQTIQTDGSVATISAKGLFPDREGALKERLGPGQCAQTAVKQRHVIE